VNVTLCAQYPSIIREYNVCFTTIEQHRDALTGEWQVSVRDSCVNTCARTVVH
jgi:DNA polymerase elongation subunit (family B)